MEQGFLIKTTCVVLTLTIFIYCTNANTELMKRKLSGRVVSTKFGKLRGLLIEMPDDYLPPVDAYLGLQYASVLGKELRFLPPTSPMEQWSGIRVAISHRPVCPQTIPDLNDLREKMPKSRVEHFERIIPFLREQREDCLSLNMYVPAESSNITSSSAYPVVVFVHGEAYDFGTGNAYDGSVLASYGRVVVVTLNYRLGPLGFLSTGDHYGPGNCALMDILAALQWLKENVRAFGGDPHTISLMGHSHGAVLVNLLMVSPITSDGNLFKRGIVMSGSALASWASTEHPRFYTSQLAELVNCSSFIEHSAELFDCFRAKSADHLMDVSSKIRAPRYLSKFGPVIHSSSVLPENVRALLTKAVRRKCSLLVGVTTNKGRELFSQKELELGLQRRDEYRIYRSFVNNVYKFHRQRIYDVINHHYTTYDREQNNLTTLNDVAAMLADSQFTTPVIELASRHARIHNTYFYTFTTIPKPDAPTSETHFDDELPYVFGAPLVENLQPFPSSLTHDERFLSEAVMKYWANFIKSGDPNRPDTQDEWHASSHVKNKFANIQFPLYSLKHQSLLNIEQRPNISQRYRAREASLWLDLIPKIHRADHATAEGVTHLLDEHENTSLFLKDTRDVDLHIRLPPEPRTTRSPTENPQRLLTKQNATLEATMAPRPLDRARPSATNDSVKSDSPLALGVVVIVGAALLFLNVLVFAIVYYQSNRKRSRTDRKNSITNVQDDRNNHIDLNESPTRHDSIDIPITTSSHSKHVYINSKHVSRDSLKDNSHLPNGGLLRSDSPQQLTSFAPATKRATFSPTVWTYSPDTDTKEPMTVL